MKIQFRQLEQFVKSPDKKARVILVYGPDSGLVSERSAVIGKTIVDDLNDPFNVADLSVEALAENPARLVDEANAISMMGGDRLVMIKGGGDKLTVLVKSYLVEPSAFTLVVIQAGELGPRSSLRKLCESAKNAVALPCYVEDERDVSRFVRDTLQAANLRVDADAVAWLAANISGDRRKVRSELEKLITYKGEEQSAVSLNDVRAACGAAGAQGFDDLVYNVGGRNSRAALKAYATLMAEGTAFVAILRSLQNHFRRLHMTKSYMQDGMDMDSAMKKLSPPIFFKQAPKFKSQLNSWSLPILNQVLGKLTELEAQCKQTGMPVDTLCSQAILAISKIRKS
ncbi:MAG: DNA polymerase III subunit delta [Zetaproteobacteria bacterium]|nr:MAG: DNA polymerase III subunit delta [Zetaproteobacteria bacterium]